ncbi:MAG: class I SAM-dependent methyltransferase [Patescibacteria group bacterium]
MQKKAKTSWGEVAEWYQQLLSGEGTYQKEVILPNLLRLLEIKKGEVILDLACGPGFFTNEFSKQGAKVIGADIAFELIKIAKQNSPPDIKYFVSTADKLSFLADKSVDKITIILSIQNIENVSEVFKECVRALKSGGKLFLVMNHPAFRVPKESSWGWDEQNNIQYRRVDSYLFESKVKIQMRPGSKPDEHTLTFHRPLQFYFKALQKTGFLVSRLEEWNSNKKSEQGPRALAENRARKEIPLFLFLEAVIKT